MNDTKEVESETDTETPEWLKDKTYASSGVSARTGSNYALIGSAWQHRWGGGL
jgi:hypothetical protein